MNLPIPQIMTHDIYNLSAEDFAEFGIKFLMMDLDNTLAPYHLHEATDELRAWLDSLKNAGIELFILSNNHGQRPALYSKQLGIDYINRAKKPNAKNALDVISRKGYDLSETALIGDQIYTDVLCAVRCNILPVCVRPICISRNPLMAIRYLFELPFRYMYRGKKYD